MTLEIKPFTSDHIDQAARLFVEKVGEFRKSVTALPDVMENPANVMAYLEEIVSRGNGLAVIEGDRLVGYLAWFQTKDFRDTGKRAVYVPEWGHCVQGEREATIWPELFAQAASLWAEKKIPIWSMTCLANDSYLESFVFHNGYGMIVEDAVRKIEFQAKKLDPTVKVCKCNLQDAELIARLDKEHCSHYSMSPVLMTPRQVESTETVREFLAGEKNSYWVAEVDGIAAGFMRFEAISHGAAAVVRSELTVAITGAFTRPEFRGRGVATAILHYALADYTRLGYLTCSVDYETINPQAYAFWPKYFQPVCFSVVRYPEQFLS